jgi:hypothetical protein
LPKSPESDMNKKIRQSLNDKIKNDPNVSEQINNVEVEVET